MSLLESLYLERAALTDKLRKLNDLIAVYESGQLPAYNPPAPVPPVAAPPVPAPAVSIPEVPDPPVAATLFGPRVPEPPKGPAYPLRGTWKDKILYVMAWYQRPVVVADIAARILELEPELSEKELPVTIGQYCSVMGKNGEIGTDKSEYRNKYYLQP